MPYRDFRTALRDKLDALYERRAALELEIAHAEAVLQLSRGDQLRGHVSTLVWAVAAAVTVGIGFVGLTYAVQPTCGGNPFGRTRTDGQNIISAVQLYAMDHPDGPYPTAQRLKGDYLDESKPLVDAWGRRFLLLCVEETAVVISAGPDGEHGAEDDMRWDVLGPPRQPWSIGGARPAVGDRVHAPRIADANGWISSGARHWPDTLITVTLGAPKVRARSPVRRCAA